MTEKQTMVDALRTNAQEVGNERGILFYETPESSQYRGLADLDERARTIAHALSERGYRPGERVVIGFTDGLGWVDAVWGLLYAGLALVPAPIAGYGTGAALSSRVEEITRAAEASLFVTDAGVLERLGGGLLESDIPMVKLDELLIEGDPNAWARPPIDADSMTHLLFTSGSTGDPKGVIATHGTMMGLTSMTPEWLGLDRDSVIVGWAPMHHAMGLIFQVLFPAVVGCNAVVTSTEQFQRRPVFWLQLISRHSGTITVAGNFAFALVTQLATEEQIAALDLSSLRAMACGSEPVRPETVQGFLQRFKTTGLSPDVISPSMGMTEGLVFTAKFINEPMITRSFNRSQLESGHLVPARSAGEDAVEMVSCGHPHESTTLVIVDPDTLLPVPDGTIGEIWVSSPMVSPGYFRRPDATAETFGLTLPGSEKSFLRSGDLAAVVDGQLYVTGRLKEMIIIRGRNLYPQDIEAVTRSISPAVGISAAFELEGHPSAVGIVLEQNDEALAESGESLDDLGARVRETLLHSFSLPSVAVAFVPETALPRTPTGKIRRTSTRSMVERAELPITYSSGFRPTGARD